ncbi:MAG: hypothetical protein OXL34_11830 [Gemmatimonadota bacterium]|nr:hypothetical protein [Gemmatimonadota bacterium]
MSLARSLMPGLALTLFLAACEGDPVEPENQLSEEEAVALLKGAGLTLAQVLEDSTLIVGGSENGLVARCPLGGQAELVGAFTEETGDTARLGADFLITPRECVIAADGIQFTTDPGPALRYQLLVEIIAATFEFNISGMITGGVDWTLDDRSGNCAMNLTLEAVPDLVNETLTGAYKGMLCGHEVEIDAAALLVVDL